jgi:hypothetical protein
VIGKAHLAAVQGLQGISLVNNYSVHFRELGRVEISEGMKLTETARRSKHLSKSIHNSKCYEVGHLDMTEVLGKVLDYLRGVQTRINTLRSFCHRKNLVLLHLIS